MSIFFFQDSTEEYKLPRKKQKVSVPVFAMTTPAGLSCSEIHNKSVYQGTTASENAFDCRNNTCKRDVTSSKCGPKSTGFQSPPPLATGGNTDSCNRKSEGNSS